MDPVRLSRNSGDPILSTILNSMFKSFSEMYDATFIMPASTSA
jgi:hypothetical protein